MFAAMMWATHFSPLFNASLEDPLIHDLEHMLFLTGALLFWWPAVALDPAPWRMSHPARIGYLFTQMTQNTFLAVVILNATAVLYPHYATLVRPWGMAALEDQRLAAGIMWIAGDAVFLTAILAVVAGWMRAEARNEARDDRRADAELVADPHPRAPAGRAPGRRAGRDRAARPPAAGRQPSGGIGASRNAR